MEEFLTRLYSYDNFTTYLIISIIVLFVLFFVILFFGKKDQKNREIEATKKLMKINEENVPDQFVMNDDVKNEQEKLENDTIIVPNINEIEQNINEVKTEEIPEPVLPVEENKEEKQNTEEQVVDTFKEEENSNPVEVLEEPKEEIKDIVEPTFNEPVLSKEEEKTFSFADFKFDEEPTNLVLEEKTEAEKIVPDLPKIEVPEFNYDEIIKNVEETKKEEVKKAPEVFSSVYVPEKKVEEPKQEELKEIKDEEEEIELPTLKKEVTLEENKEIPNYNLEDISGETYNLR